MPENASAILCYVTHRQSLAVPEAEQPQELLRTIERVAAAGVDWIQIREKDLPTRELLALVERAVVLTRGTTARILVNDRLDVALAAAASGVHLGGESMPVREVAEWVRRRPEGAGFLVGASCHALAEAQAAEQDGADYIFFGPLFATPEKLKYGPPQGTARLAEVCRAVRIPVIAIGGITKENAAECLAAGAAGIAAIRLFQETAEPAPVVRHLRAL